MITHAEYFIITTDNLDVMNPATGEIDRVQLERLLREKSEVGWRVLPNQIPRIKGFIALMERVWQEPELDDDESSE